MECDPFFDTTRKFIHSEATWDEVEKADLEYYESRRQWRAMVEEVERGLANPETSAQVLDLLLSMRQSVPIA